MASGAAEKGYQRNAWILILVASILIVISGIGIFPPLQPPWPSTYPAPAVSDLNFFMTEVGLAWAFWGFLVGVIAFTGYRKGERWAWYALWSLPVASLMFAVLAPGSFDIPITIFLTVPGLLLPFRKFFPKTGEATA